MAGTNSSKGKKSASGTSSLGSTPTITTANGNPLTWAEDLIATADAAGMDLPNTTNNIEALLGWQTAEGSSAAYNPLDSTLGSAASGVTVPGSSNYNSAGVQNYASQSQGLAEEISTLGESSYSQIVADLKTSAPAQTTADAISSSPWGTEAFTPPTSITGKANSQVGTASGTPPAGGTTPAGGKTPAGGTSGSLLAKVGAFLLGGAILLVGLIIAFHSSGAQKGVEDVAKVAPLAAA